MLQEHSQIAILLDKAKYHFNTADHIAYVTYPLVKDNKLIITVTENLAESLTKAIEALLFYERMYKRIPLFPENFDSRMQIFKSRIADRYNIERQALVILQDLRTLVIERKHAPMEFIRKDKYVITNHNYSKISTITMEKLKNYINESKPFIKRVNLILKNVGR